MCRNLFRSLGSVEVRALVAMGALVVLGLLSGCSEDEIANPIPDPIVESDEILIVSDVASAVVYRAVLDDLELESTFLPSIPMDLGNYRGIVLSSYTASSQPGCAERIRNYVNSGGRLYLDGGNPDFLLAGCFCRSRLPSWLGGGQMVYQGGYQRSYASVDNPFGTAIYAGQQVFTDYGGGAYINGSQAAVLATSNGYASAVQVEPGKGRLFWATSCPGDSRNPAMADVLFLGGFRWLFVD